MGSSYNAWSNIVSTRNPLNEDEGPATRLVRSLISIQDRKKQREMEEARLQMMQQEEARRAAEDQWNKQLQLYEIAANAAALKERGTETKEKTVATTPLTEPTVDKMSPEEMEAFTGIGEEAPLPDQGIPVTPQGTPESLPLTVKEEVPAPQKTFRLGDMEIPLESATDVRERGELDFQQKLDQAKRLEREKALAGGARELTPEMIGAMPDEMRPFFQSGMLVEPPNLSSALAAKMRESADPFANYKGVAGGYLEKTPEGVRFRDTTPTPQEEPITYDNPLMLDAIGTATARMPRDRRMTFAREIKRRIDTGDEGSAKAYVTQAILANEDVATRNDLQSRAETLNILKHVDTLLSQVPTNFVRGTFEDTMRLLGKTSNPQYVQIANEMKSALYAYRKAMTGVQFSIQESQDYERMFPNYRSEPPVNKAALEGLKTGFEIRNSTFWDRRVGPEVSKYLGVSGSSESEAPLIPPPGLSEAGLAYWKKMHGGQ